MHKRSRHKLLERRIRALIFTNAYVDTRKAEKVSMLNRVDVLSMLDGVIDVRLVPDVTKGEVLVDSRGTGSFQHWKKVGRGGVIVKMRRAVIDRVGLYLGKMDRLVNVDSQAIRAKLLKQLDALFDLAFSIVKGSWTSTCFLEGSLYACMRFCLNSNMFCSGFSFSNWRNVACLSPKFHAALEHRKIQQKPDLHWT